MYSLVYSTWNIQLWSAVSKGSSQTFQSWHVSSISSFKYIWKGICHSHSKECTYQSLFSCTVSIRHKKKRNNTILLILHRIFELQYILSVNKSCYPNYVLRVVHTLFNDLTRDSIANNFVIDVYCRCLQILYQIVFFSFL